jgi:arabinofuranan 3-O-arabinosyltransferase
MSIYAREMLPVGTAADLRLADRLELIGFALGIAYLVFLGGAMVQGYWLLDSSGRPLANDFVNVWAAGQLALQGAPAAAYDWTIHRQAEVAALGHAFDGYYGWHYPPTFLFVACALALLPYVPAALLWLVVTLPAYVATMRAIVGRRAAILLALGFPGVAWCLSAGQNGFLTAALIGASLVCLQRRPVLAGVFLGMLTYKPQFGLLFPLVLAIGGQWRTIVAAAATSLSLAAAAWLAFGSESWHAFIEWMPATSDAVFAQGRAGLGKLQSLFGLVRWLGGGVTLAWICQGALACVGALLLALLWRERIAFELKASALATAAMLATPYLYMYDFPVLAVPIAFLLRLALTARFLPGERSVLAAVCVTILIYPLLVAPVGLLAVAMVAALIARRVIAARIGSSSHPPASP